MGTKKYSNDYLKKMQTSWEYQDYVCWKLSKVGFFICNMQSRKYQLEIGENLLGLEIKEDKKYAETGNLYIEVAEKTNSRNSEFIPSGIYCDDYSFLYGIGNYEIFYIFSRRTLTLLDEEEPDWLVRKEINQGTSQGFLIPRLPEDRIAEYMEMYIKLEDEEITYWS